MAKEKAKTGAKDFFLWAGAMVALYWSVVAFIFLVFDYINYAMPDPLNYYPSDPYQSSIPYDMASLIVLVPIYLIIRYFIRRDIMQDSSRSEIWVRRWALILTLFIAGLTAAIDLIVVLTSFLRGDELTVAFLLKVLIVLMVAAIAFMHFIADLWGYWVQYPQRANSVGIGVGILVALTIVAGFFIVGTPQQARARQFDAEKVSDLQNIQSQIVDYYQQEQKLPATLSDLSDSISGFAAPTDAQTGASYEYIVTDTSAFELCATFNAPGVDSSGSVSYPTPAGAEEYVIGQNNWQHGAGRTCFDREIDPTRYPSTTPPSSTKGAVPMIPAQ